MSLHSRYNPVREAERYVDAVGIAFQPAYIVVSEPGESWLAGVLRNRFSNAFLIALRYDRTQFSDSDGLWDAVWRPLESDTPESFLFNIIPDEYLSLTVFLPWKPADAVWPAEAALVWKGIASLIRLQKDVMYTRAHFGKRWLSNMVKNLCLLQFSAQFDAIPGPVFLALSGPSLEKQFPFDRDRFFLCAVSSALSCLSDKGIDPDLCIATDGGNWALPLFRDIATSVPVAFPLEAAIPSGVLEHNPGIFLTYGSALETELFSSAGIAAATATRNGTVAGTAVQFLLSHTTASSSVYAAGLDLQNTTSFSHARPHPSLVAMESSVYRLAPQCHDLFLRNRETVPLDTYASWFSSRHAVFGGRLFRLAPAGRRIDGIPVTDIGSIQRRESNVAALHRKEIISTDARKEKLISFFSQFIDQADACRTISDSQEKKKRFTAVMTGIGAYPELLQMISYTGYLNVVKTMSKDGDAEPACNGIDAICVEAARFASALIRKVRSYGS